MCVSNGIREPALSTCMYQWCGLRPSVFGQDRSETKKIVLVLVLHAVVLVLVLVWQVWCCVVKHGLITLVIIMTLKGTLHSNF